MNTSTLWALPLALLLLACQKGKNTTQTPPQQSAPAKTVIDTTALFAPLPATQQEFLKAQKAHKPIIDTVEQDKHEGRVTLGVHNQKTPMIFKDVVSAEDETENIKYSYVGEINDPDLYIIKASLWESEDYYLINKFTHKIDTLWGIPVFSPDRSRIVNLSPAYGMEGDPNGIQLWKVDNYRGSATLAKVKEINQEEWIPLEVYWLNNRTLVFRAVSVDNFMKAGGKPQEKEVHYFKMKV